MQQQQQKNQKLPTEIFMHIFAYSFEQQHSSPLSIFANIKQKKAEKKN